MSKPDLSLQVEARLLAALGEAALLAAEAGARRAYEELRPRRKQAHGAGRRPGPDTPLWNVLADQLKPQLATYGSKTRLAAHLGLPPQRITDFLSGRRRLPDGEITLRLLHWLCERQAGRDPSLCLPSPARGRPRGKPKV